MDAKKIKHNTRFFKIREQIGLNNAPMSVEFQEVQKQTNCASLVFDVRLNKKRCLDARKPF